MSSTRGGNSFHKEVNPLICLLPHAGRSFTSLPDGPSANDSLFANDHLKNRTLPSPFFGKKAAELEKQCSPKGTFPPHNKAQRKGHPLGATDNRVSPLACMIPSKRNSSFSNMRHIAKNDSVHADKPSELQMDVESLFTSCIDLGVVSVSQRNSVVADAPSKQLHTMTRKDKKKFRRVRHYLGKMTKSEDTLTLLTIEGSDSDTDEDEDSLSTENSSDSSIPSLGTHSVEEERVNETLNKEKLHRTNTNQKVEKGRISNVREQQQRSVHFHTCVSVYEYPPVNSVVVSRKHASYYPRQMAPIREEDQSNLSEGARSI
uniref:Uncharacterized protein n=1 Tax=Attheya septentrionalis TaxID=420275 RepID=A0A7S2XR87_9STRA|mmetsp:Transcript_28615/g.52268  ORF Transcript_28615/g.52268 Transcript_28615/m.52268 type:complete len:317 (+) Transcript_28615:151-1101(+)|eukprot:CAMPEP_0198281272 /NCGR_PEP_ID=MMETSP1449-20131203/1247_1 /TAXON_ID=420275 /ORGANISM="Attheya septentrionalis, Strain CCMP2084" /LENGTH=316 /DNA_ID=CAMNT_0043976983 /DNA_START=76 /DNA_END=1026 /DNA_ORIENTATION=+